MKKLGLILLVLMFIAPAVHAQALSQTELPDTYKYEEARNKSVNRLTRMVKKYDREFKSQAQYIWGEGCAEAQLKVDAYGNQGVALFQQSGLTEQYLMATFAQIPNMEYVPIEVPCAVAPVIEDGQMTGYMLITDKVVEPEPVVEVDEAVYPETDGDIFGE